MPRLYGIEYECPRCNYNTRQKNDMKKHLYNLKQNCPPHRDDLALTEEIKRHILEHRFYKRPSDITHSSDNQPDTRRRESVSITERDRHMSPLTVQNVDIGNQIINVQNNINITQNNDIKTMMNNYKFIQNIVNKMDPITKVNHILEYQNATPVEYDPYLEQLFQDRLCKMDEDVYKRQILDSPCHSRLCVLVIKKR